MRKRRFLAILLAALLMFGVMSAQAPADDDLDYQAKIIYADGTSAGFVDATKIFDNTGVVNTTDKDITVTLLKDITVSQKLTIDNKNGAKITLDLNGKTISVATYNSGDHPDGEYPDWNGEKILNSPEGAILVINQGNVTITGNGIIDATGAKLSAPGAYNELLSVAAISIFGECTIESGTFKADGIVVNMGRSGSEPSKLQIKGGTFNGGKDNTLLVNSSSVEGVSTPNGYISITGGCFGEFDPSEFVVDGCTASKDADGKYTVGCGDNKLWLMNENTIVGAYETVEDAMAAISKDGTYTIDLQGNTVELSKGITVSGNKTISIKNGTLKGDGLENVFIVKDADSSQSGWENELKLEDCTLEFTGVKGYLLNVEQSSQVLIKNCKITATGTDTAVGFSLNRTANFSNCTIKLSGFAVGLHASKDFTIFNTELTITGCSEYDLYLENDTPLNFDTKKEATSKVVVGKMIAYDYAGSNGVNTYALDKRNDPDGHDPGSTPGSNTGYTPDSDYDSIFNQNGSAAVLIDAKGGQLDLCPIFEDKENQRYSIDYYTAQNGVTLTEPTRDGYKFEGWYSDEEYSGDKISKLPADEPAATEIVPITPTPGEIINKPETTADGNLTAYAKWSSTSSYTGGKSHKTYYTVMFDSNGGSKVANQTVKKNNTASEPTAPTKDGYTFAGWYSDSKLKTEFDFDTKITKATTLYAKWDEKTGTGTEAETGAGGSNSYCIILTLDKYEALVYGESKLNDVTPLAVNNRVMMPTRFVAENLFCTVHWDRETGIITISGINFVSGASMEIILTVNSNTATVNGKTVTLDSTTFVKNNRIYTPLRFIAETLGATVDWNSSTKKITVTLPATTISDELIATLKDAK